MKKQKHIYFVYTHHRIDAGQKPYQTVGLSAQSIARSWQRRYNEVPVKVVIAVFNVDGTFTADEQGEKWIG
jgi:metal-dependent HD superfamily phosphatase/phosphodiesterase